MLKVGIFGDSFSDPIRHGHDNFRELDELGWPNLLKHKHEVGLYGQGGSSIFYSYQKFLEHHSKYDKIVFVVTDPLRWIKGYSLLGRERHFSNYWTADNFLKVNKKELRLDQIDLLEAIKSYYLHMADDPSSYQLAHLIINHMKQIRPDIILIPIDQTLLDINVAGFQQYIDVFYNTIGLKKFNGDIYYEYRLICHLSKEMNKLMAEHVEQALETGIWDPVLPKYVNHEFTNIDYYFRPISEIDK